MKLNYSTVLSSGTMREDIGLLLTVAFQILQQLLLLIELFCTLQQSKALSTEGEILALAKKPLNR